jgi:hypothetical protein
VFVLRTRQYVAGIHGRAKFTTKAQFRGNQLGLPKAEWAFTALETPRSEKGKILLGLNRADMQDKRGTSPDQ